MGMIGTFVRVSQNDLSSFLKDSSLLEDLIYDENADENADILDVDKAWDGIFYLLTGEGLSSLDFSDPNSMKPLLICNQMLDDEQNLGYGPAHYITPSEVKEFNTTLAKETKESLHAKYNPADMGEKVYPMIWETEGDDAFEYVYLFFEELQQFYKKAAEENMAIIFYMS